MSTWLGIDIGTTAVKVAAIRTAYRKIQLVGLESVELAQAGGVEQAITLATRAVLGERGSADAVATSVAGAKCTVRVLGLPASASKQLGEVLPFELESALPFDLADAVFDYRVQPGERDRKGEELSVLVGVARTTDVASRIEILRTTLGIEPERVGLGAFPIANLVPYLPALAEGLVAVVDLGTTSCELLILSNGEPVFSRSLDIGTGGLPASARKLERELRTTLGAYRAQGGEKPARMLLCGGGAYSNGAEAFLSSALGVRVEILPLPALETTLAPEQLAAMPARFAKAIGLAMGLGARPIGLNLRKGPLAFERGFAWIKDKVPVLAGLAAVILVSFLFSAWAQLYAKSKERDVLEKALGSVTKEVLGEETTSAERANELLTSQTTLADEDPLPHADGFDVMEKLSELIPTSIQHDIEELDVQKGHVIVHGIVGSIPDAQAIRTSMANEPCFSDAKITRTNAAVGSDRQKYVLEFDIKCPEDQKGTKKSAAASPSGSAATPSGAGSK